MVAGWRKVVGGTGDKGKGIQQYKLVVTKQLRGCKVWHRKQSILPDNYIPCQMGTRLNVVIIL